MGYLGLPSCNPTSAFHALAFLIRLRLTIVRDYKQEAFEKCWAHSPLRAAARRCFTLPFTRCRYCRTLPAYSYSYRCPQRQRVIEGNAMAP